MNVFFYFSLNQLTTNYCQIFKTLKWYKSVQIFINFCATVKISNCSQLLSCLVNDPNQTMMDVCRVLYCSGSAAVEAGWTSWTDAGNASSYLRICLKSTFNPRRKWFPETEEIVLLMLKGAHVGLWSVFRFRLFRWPQRPSCSVWM